jgi:hypothetical protein
VPVWVKRHGSRWLPKHREQCVPLRAETQMRLDPNAKMQFQGYPRRPGRCVANIGASSSAAAGCIVIVCP